MKTWFCSVLLLIALPSEAANQTLTLMLDWFVNPNHAPIIIAQQRGYFKQHGLEVTIQEPADPALPPKLVAAQKADLAVTYQPDLIMDVSAGLPLMQTGTLIATPLNCLIVLNSSNIRTLADLKGKKIGIAIPGNEQANIGTMLATVDVNYASVTIVNVGWALTTALASGKVDAIWGGFRNFEVNQLKQAGYATRVFYPEEHGVPTYNELVFVANKNAHNQSAIVAFNQALTQAATFIENHPQQAWKDFVSYSPDTLNNQLNQQAWQDTLARFALRPQAVDRARYDRYATFLYQNHIISAPLSAKDYIATFD